ncbi:MAG TPA: response regulator, partial [Polyangiaceae bacterium LLY-WYZ-15_(1-7)]|nr:response regulator [Polyangiaceae bacterium LLY-WYZ-15_(1-7)]
MVDRPRILVVDDEEVIRDVLADFLSLEEYAVTTAADGESALAELRQSAYDLVLSDLKMPRMGGLELLAALEHERPAPTTVIMTGFGTVETAIEAMKRGAHDYILKPFRVEEVVLTVRRALEKQRLAAENLRLRDSVALYSASERIAGSLSLDAILRTVLESARGSTQA